MSRPPAFDELAIARLAQEQDQVVSRTQLAGLDVARHHIGHRADSGRWQPIGPRVVVLHTGLLNERQRWWVATLHSGPRSALAGLTAATAEGLSGFASPVLHTVVPHGVYAPELDHSLVTVRPRQSRLLTPDRVHPAKRPPRLRLPPALVTGAEACSSDERARLVILSGIQQRLVRPADLRDVLDQIERLARRGLIIEAVNDAEGGAHSLPERTWSLLCRTHGLPAPTRQQKIQRSTGTWYLDSDFEEWLVTVEVNGSQHELWERGERDDHRRNVLGISGRLVITLSSHGVRHAGELCVVTVAAALLSRGWQPGSAVYDRLRAAAIRTGIDLVTGDRLGSARSA
ncbi:MAG: hypothetical protein H0U35_02860 [Sporichthyaceae bacterium]|nr:hypothetical protein [Sporichthyaceae bacterium]